MSLAFLDMGKVVWSDGRVEYATRPSDRELVLKQIKVFDRLLESYSDGSPAKVVHSTCVDNKYKCRAGWWGVLAIRFGELHERGLLPEEISEEYHSVMRNYEVHLQERRGLTSPEDISAANSLVIKTLSSLRERLSSGLD